MCKNVALFEIPQENLVFGSYWLSLGTTIKKIKKLAVLKGGVHRRDSEEFRLRSCIKRNRKEGGISREDSDEFLLGN